MISEAFEVVRSLRVGRREGLSCGGRKRVGLEEEIKKMFVEGGKGEERKVQREKCKEKTDSIFLLQFTIKSVTA